MRSLILTLALLAAGAATPATAVELPTDPEARKAAIAEAATKWFNAEFAPLIALPSIIDAIYVQNEATNGYDEAKIIELDKAWRKDVSAGASPLVRGVLDHPASRVLLDSVAQAGGVVTEIFIMDAKGLNVAASMATSDYWQGDEAKFQETFPKGAGVIHVSDIEYDHSTGLSQIQISATVVDTLDDSVIGAITIGVVADLIL